MQSMLDNHHILNVKDYRHIKKALTIVSASPLALPQGLEPWTL